MFSREMLREADEALIDEEVERVVALVRSSGVRYPHLVLTPWLVENVPSLVGKLNAAGIRTTVVDLP